MEEMKLVASETGVLEGAALRRADHVLSLLLQPEAFDPAAAEARVAVLLGGAA
jgi:hypothetical protein